MRRLKKRASKDSSEESVSPPPQTYINQKDKNKYYLLFTSISLLSIIILGIFLRYENFFDWNEKKSLFQYQGEYQMANFDSYYYLQIAKDIQNGVYDNLDEKRRTPNGADRPSIPPLLSIISVLISRLTHIPLATVAIFIPVVLSPLLAIVVFLIGLRLNLNKFSALAAALFSITSLTYIVRTRVGVFDTDSLNVVFLTLNSYLLLCFSQEESNKRYKYLVYLIVSTFSYFIWWNTATSITLLSAIVPLCVALIFFYKTKKPIITYAIVGGIILIGFYFAYDQILSYLKLILNSRDSIFPNNMGIGELDSVSLDIFIKKTLGNQFIFITAFIGFVYLVWKHKLKSLLFTVPILLAISPFIVGNRFMIFSAPIIALSIAHFIQLLFDFKNIIKPPIAYLISIIIIAIGFFSNYTTITKGIEKPAAYDNIVLLDGLKKYTPDESSIWTDSDVGYQIQYYLDRSTFADGEFLDGELYYCLYYPLAADNLALAANYMQFYGTHGIQGMHQLYSIFSGVEETFTFLKGVLSLNPKEAELWLMKRQESNNLPKTDHLTNVKQWLSFLYPSPSKDIYLLIHYKMTQTASWFKQGNVDLKTGESKGVPLFLTLSNLKEINQRIENNQININTINGIGDYVNKTKHSFQSILTYDGNKSEIKTYRTPRTFDKKDDRFVFQWNKKIGFGVIMSQEIANTALVKLYIQNERSSYFEPIVLNTPAYQIWKIHGGVYEE